MESVFLHHHMLWLKLISGISKNQQSLSGPRSSKMEDQAWAKTGDKVFQLNRTV